jgi:hypothetical protein
VLGRPMVLAGKEAKQVQWTNVYEDALVRPLDKEGGMEPSPTDLPTGPRPLRAPLWDYPNRGKRWPVPKPLP